MNCKEINKSIIKYIDKELTPKKEKEFNEHIIDCNACSKLYSNITATYDTLNIRQEIEPKAFFTESVMNKIDIETEKTKDSIFDFTIDIAISKFFKKFAYTGIAFIIALFILLYSTNNLSLFNNISEDDDFSTNKISYVFFENY
jgi:hypothetical protein